MGTLIVGDRTFVEIPGNVTHELPPLLLHAKATRNMRKLMDSATDIARDNLDALLTDIDLRTMEMSVNLVDQYMAIHEQWSWGDSIVEWIRQCETTFGSQPTLRFLLNTDLWPHASRSSFVTLLEDKDVHADGINLENAVGLRLSFRQLPPLRCCSDQFLFYLNTSIGLSAYDAWADLRGNAASLPPERFHFEVISPSL